MRAILVELKLYPKHVIANARTLAAALVFHSYRLQTGGTDNHLILWDLCPIDLTGSKVKKVCDLMGITINISGGFRLGTSALTSCNMKEEYIKVFAKFLHCPVQLLLLLQKEAGSKQDCVCVATVPQDSLKRYKQVTQLREEVIMFASKWLLPGIDVVTLTRHERLHE
ncbi:Serine hydroxymethyltransferase 6 [Psilocybe cubensis]|uniref:Serine hydroxymethyltransferase 6 n=1 Tax=Psilocybe cubensis TaxID=181762 RepID=A0ACB8GNH2_PSICU|nr:Serine hydroxymethyltransferase 6 [Psilocybe cubensis]KAH9476771.1 Serine hydroxymethyltransferase 6 [Psilocybe cubensis]